MTESRARRDLDFDYVLDDPDDNDGWFGQAQAAEPAPLHEVDDAGHDDPHANWEDDPDTDQWYMPAQVAGPIPEPEVDGAEPDDAHDSGWDDPRESRWNDLYAPRNGQNGAPRIGEWTFSVVRPQPWYRKKYVKTGLVAAATAAIAVPLVLLVVRSLASGAEESTTVPTTAPTSAQPAPTSAAPALSTAKPSAPAPPPPPPPPPPAPPPPEQTNPAPVIQQYPQQRQTAPDQTDKPEIGVTRTPATRAPISAKPPAPPPPARDSRTPGDAPGGGWGW
jgi:hypothetical protein